MWSIYLLAIVAVLLYVWLQRRREYFQYFEKRGIKGPKPGPLFGNGFELWRKSQPTCFQEWQKQYGNVYGYFNGANPAIVVCDKEILKDILIKNFSSFMDHGYIFGRGGRDKALPQLTGDRWRHVRSTLTPSFTTSKLKAISTEMSAIVDEFQEHVEKAANAGEDFDIHKLLQALTTDVICRIGMGINYGAIKNPNHPIMERISSAFRVSYSFVLVILISLPSLSFLVHPFIKLMETLKNRGDTMKNPGELIMEDCTKVIQMRRKNPSARRTDLLQLLLDARYQQADDASLTIDEENERKEALKTTSNSTEPGLTDDEVLQNAWIVMIAGYETTASTLSSLSFLLMRNPKVQDKLRQELQNNIKNKRNIDFETLQKLPYMDAVIKETLRLYSPAILLTRLAIEDVELANGLKVFKDETIVVPIDAVHLQEEYFEEPTKFRPERFLNGETDPIAFLPFGNGPRNCIGMRFAQMEIKLTLAKILLNYRLEPSVNTPEKYELAAMAALKRFEGKMYAKATKL